MSELDERNWACQQCRMCEVCLPAPGEGPDVSDLVNLIVEEVLSSYSPQERRVPVGVSARHVHVTKEHLERLFGEGHHLTKLRDLYQPGEFAANETLTVVGPKRRLFEQVRILGPIRSFTQVELSYSDGVYLGLDLPYRLSGNIRGSAPLILIGPKGVLHLPEGGIRAARHIHINPQDARRLGVRSGQTVSVRTSGPMSLVFNNVIIREKEDLRLQMHIDTDEANAAGIRCGDTVELLSEGKQVQ